MPACMLSLTSSALHAQDEGRSLLAAATRKRLLLYQFDGGELVELRDFGLADISCLAWLGDNLCAGVKRECAPQPLSQS